LAYGWFDLSVNDATLFVYADQNVSSMYWALTMTQQEFDAIKPSSPVGPLPPIWPGFDAVTLLTPVSLTPSFTITEECHGCLIELDTVPDRIGFFTYGDTISYRNVGSLAFWNDNGWDEEYQVMGFFSMVFMPKTMEIAAGIDVRTLGGVGGTLTPFLIN
jgi:hypothetical protein